MQSEKQIEAAARADAEYAGRTFDALSSADKTRFRDRAKLMLEAALSADADPVGYTDQSELTNDRGHGLFAHASSDRKWLGDNPVALYAAPVKTAPAVAVKALTLDALTRYFASLDAGDIGFSDMPAALYTYLLMDGYIPEESARQEVRSALSAQVQDVAVDGADIGRCIRSLSVEHPLKWAEAEKTPILRGWFVGQVVKHFDGKPDEKLVRELIDIVFAMYPASPAPKHGDAE